MALVRWMVAWVAFSAGVAGSMSAQDTPTIHVYTDRVQIPVLVLGQHREDLQPVAASEFRVMLDGHEFPTMIRREGDDPLEVTILVDTSDDKNALLPLLQSAVVTLDSKVLKPTDHVSVYGMDGCRLRRTRKLAPTDIPAIATAVHEAALFPSAERSSCMTPAGLWDVLWYLTNSMSELPGRRIIIPITNGSDIGSKKTPYAVWQAAIQYGVSLFPLSERGHVAGASKAADNKLDVVMKAENLLSVSEMSGGIISEAIPPNLGFSIARIFRIVRSRYVLEFPRPKGMFGHHGLEVSLRTTRAMVRTGGLEFPAKRGEPSESVTTSALPELELPSLHSDPAPANEAASPALPAEVKPSERAIEKLPVTPGPIVQPVRDVTDITDELRPH